jgi:hypothetical protein
MSDETWSDILNSSVREGEKMLRDMQDATRGSSLFPKIAVFNPDNLLEDMLVAKSGTVFMLGENRVKHHEGDDTVEMTFAVIQRTTDNPTTMTHFTKARGEVE